MGSARSISPDVPLPFAEQTPSSLQRGAGQWRRARLDRGATYSLTQRTAFEVLVTMQPIYGTVE